MGKKLELTGQIFNRLTVIKEVKPYISPKGNRQSKWLCLCSCGQEKEIRGHDLKNNKTKSCGCLIKEKHIARFTKHGDATKDRNSPYNYLYRTWIRIKQCCLNPNNQDYEYYGGRGITVYSEWIDNYQAFKDYILKNLGERTSSKHSIDRIDNNKNYEPGNLRWATHIIQGINQRRRKTNRLGHKGIDWSKANNKWRARITVNKKTINLGYFSNLEEAIKSRKLAEEKYFKSLLA